MNRRFARVFRGELRYQMTRPLFWVFLVILFASAWGLSSGNMRIAAGDSDVGGEKMFVTSEFAMGFVLSVLGCLYYAFFVAVQAGMAIVRDEELKVGEILHATPLTPGEYVWGKFSAIFVTFLAVLFLQLVFHAFFNHVVPNPSAAEFRGPFDPLAYLKPALLFVVPFLILGCGTLFAIGERTRKPILMFSTPVAFIIIWAFFLIEWSPSWLDPRINRLLMWIDPSGFRWFNEVWLKVDRGVSIYNQAPIGLDGTIIGSRLAMIALGLGSVVLTHRNFARAQRGKRVSSRELAESRAILEAEAAGRAHALARASGANRELALASPVDAAPAEKPLSHLGMCSSVPGFLRGVLTVAKFEAKNLRNQPGLYLFVPLIVLQAIENGYFRTGPFDTRLLRTSGTFAASSMNTLTLLVCLLILFFTVESVLRERNTGVAPIVYSTPARSGALLFGKAIANSIVGVVVLFAAFLGGAGVMMAQGKVSIELEPFLLIWGLLLILTFLVWSSFVMAVLSLVRDRYLTYAIGLGILILSGFLQTWGKMNWVWNWDLWSAITWTDFGSIEPNGFAVLWNRIFYLCLTGLFLAIAVRAFPRRELDVARVMDRMRPKPILQGLLRMSPFWATALAAGIFLGIQVQQGFQGKAVEQRERDHWRKNILTWLDAKQPYIAGVDVDLTLDPSRSHFAVTGSYDLFHDGDRPMESFALSVGDHFDSLKWTLDGAALEPEDRERLFVFHMDPPLAAYDTIRVGFSHEGRIPDGVTKNGGGLGEFILPSGVVLTSFSNSFLPTVGFSGERGVDPEHPLEAKVFPKNFYVGKTKPAFGSQRPYPVRTRITGPDSMEYHGVGVQTAETVENGLRTVVWESDEPVNFFNVVGATWEVWQGEGTAIYYYAEHDYNLEEMGVALDAARKYFSEWFYPFPWRELRLNEFPGLASYAQGFPSNITFSESIGFLTRSSPEVNTAFLVTAHEAAHQWWGNLLLPGEGPGGNILSEGMAHFSTILLFDQVHGERGRIEFCKRIEEQYGDNRQVDSERPLVLIDGSRPGDNTATYDKGGWVFWMLHDLMGADSSLAGIQQFMRTYHVSDDHPVLQDYVAALRPHAPDPTAFDAFVQQWFHEVVVPEFAFTDVAKSEVDGKWSVTATVENKGTGRVPVEIAVTRGERFPDQEKDDSASDSTADATADGSATEMAMVLEPNTDESRDTARADVPGDSTDETGEREDLHAGGDTNGSPAEGEYRDARVSVVLGPGESQSVRIECAFEPERILVDPDARVLQLRREAAVEDL